MGKEEKPWQSGQQQCLEDHTWIWLMLIEIWKRQPLEPQQRSVLSTIWMTFAREPMIGPPNVLDEMSAKWTEHMHRAHGASSNRISSLSEAEILQQFLQSIV